MTTDLSILLQNDNDMMPDEAAAIAIAMSCSYRHLSHAGNHGDVLKHLIFLCVLRELTSLNEEGILVMDTHAGVGQYALHQQHKKEYQTGIERLVLGSGANEPPSAVKAYVETVQGFHENSHGELRMYPGSPALAHMILRDQDAHLLWELNPSEFQALQAFLRGISSRATVLCQDGFTEVSSKLVDDRQCVILVDPPYNEVNEYFKTLQAVEQVLHQDSSATVMVWLPQLALEEAMQLDHNLLQAACEKKWVHASLTVSRSGLRGSTVLVVNPPPGLYATLKSTMPWLAEQLSQDCSDYSLTQSP